jgi:hypothetical protein
MAAKSPQETSSESAPRRESHVWVPPEPPGFAVPEQLTRLQLGAKKVIRLITRQK